jgi:two-component system alkaline phosphatase synthesis response regulator PhoP
LPRVFIIANKSEQANKLRAELVRSGFDCLIVPYNDEAIEQIVNQSLGVMLLDTDEVTFDSEAWGLAQSIRQERQIPLIALVSREKLNGLHSGTSIDDFVVKPWELNEVTVRIKRILKQKEDIEGENIIKCGDLVIDLAKYEVSLNGKPIMLTFREYQLLKFLASNKGKVFNREALLNKVWGWDYYGGDRTVDVHIRRLRSKIEDPTHTFIETIRNIGYRLRENF